jgi:hypothetical protein
LGGAGGSGAGGEGRRQFFPTENVEKWGIFKIESVNSTSFLFIWKFSQNFEYLEKKITLVVIIYKNI